MAELNMSLFPQYEDSATAQQRGFNYAQAIQQAAQQKQDRQTQMTAGGQYANGDYTGASGTLARGGDIKTAEALRQSGQKSAEAGSEYIGRALPVLAAVSKAHAGDPDGGRQGRSDAVDHITQEAIAAGIDQRAIQAFKQSYIDSPDEALARLQAQLPAKYQTVAQGSTLVREQGDQFTPVYSAPAKPSLPSGYELGPDGKALQPMAGGPADPKVVHALGLDKREIIVNNPVPQSGQNGLKASIQLRKEFDQQPDVKAFNDVANSYDIISDIAKSPATAQNDLSLIFAYMKMLDPGSVVREGEFANAQNTAGIPDQVRNAYNKALNGQRLNPQQRKEFTNTARGVYSSRKRRYDQLVKQYQGYANDGGLGEGIIVPRLDAGPADVPAAAPAARAAIDAKTEALLRSYGVPPSGN